MAKVVNLLSKRSVTQKIREQIEKAEGEWTKETIKLKVKKNFKPTTEDVEFLYDQLLESAFTNAVSALAGPATRDEDGQIDWLGWESKVIRLGDHHYVKVRDAEVHHLQTRDDHITDNALSISASAEKERALIRLVIKEMEDNSFVTAGEALNAIRNKKVEKAIKDAR